MSTEMWTALEQYQPYADKRGHGDSWRTMTQERTRESMRAAANVAWAARYETEAFRYINKAIK